MNLCFNKYTIIYITIIVGLYLGYISTGGSKSQTIRLFDILFIGPLMIFFGYNSFIFNCKTITDLLYKNKNIKTLILLILSILLIFFGATTITYNLKNYLYFMNDQ